MIWGLIKLIILGLLVTAGVVIYDQVESSGDYSSSGNTGFQSIAAERPDVKKYQNHSNPDIGGGYNDVYHNFNCNDLNRLNKRMRDANTKYINTGKQWDYDKYYQAKRDYDALIQQCHPGNY